MCVCMWEDVDSSAKIMCIGLLQICRGNSDNIGIMREYTCTL